MGLGWDKLCGVTTDGAPAMAGERKGMTSMVCDEVRESRGFQKLLNSTVSSSKRPSVQR